MKNDHERVLKINKNSRFFVGLEQLEMDKPHSSDGSLRRL